MENEVHSERPRRSGAIKAAALVLGVLGLGAVVALTGQNGLNQCGCLPPSTQPGGYNPQETQHGTRPRLLDLGATTCIPCKRMMPVLEELKTECQGRLDVQFVDIWKMPGVANQYGVEAIPTQIFFDASGRELYRHQGFFAKDEILRKWDELGVDLTK